MTLFSATYHLRNICLAAVTLTFAALLPSCIYDSYEEPAPAPVEDGVTMSFTIVAHSPSGSAGLASRADVTPDNPYGYDEKPGTAPENYIDVANRDFRFFMFDADEKFLCDFTPDTRVALGTPGADNLVIYDCTARVDKRYFDLDAPTVTFNILAIANGYSMGQNFFMFQPGTTTIADALDRFCANPMGYVPNAAQILGVGQTAPGPQHIPMAGVQRFVVKTSAIAAENESAAINISNNDLADVTDGAPISMLRAMAKIQVIDRLYVDKDKWNGKYNEADAAIRIASVRFQGLMTSGSITPSSSNWTNHETTKQITAASKPTNGTYAPARTISFVLDALVNSGSDPQTIGKGYNVFSCYVWENDKTWVGTDKKPKIIVTLADDPTKVYEVPFAPTDSKHPLYKDYCRTLRNHIYTFEIVGIADQATLFPIYWTVCPMDNVTVDIPEYN